METRHYWEENGLVVKYDSYNSSDGFARGGEAAPEPAAYVVPPSDDEGEFPSGNYHKKGKVLRQDPMSHRIIEKRRRDRMNNCLADLSRLIPPEYLKKGRGRVEKTEIIEMAIKHLKFLQERANAAERENSGGWSGQWAAGYEAAGSDALRYLAEHAAAPAPLCAQLAAHLQRRAHAQAHAGGGSASSSGDAGGAGGSSSETASSSGSSRGYARPAPAPAPPPLQYPHGHFDSDNNYAMDCDRPATATPAPAHCSPPRRKGDDYLHSYKFKNSIERRFSRSQDSEAASHAHSKAYMHKRRRAGKPPPPASTSASASTSGSTEDTRDNSPQGGCESPAHQHYGSGEGVPVFALHALGKYYVPLTVDAGCLRRAPPLQPPPLPPLHPVTIHVNFQPCFTCSVKPEPQDAEWRPV